MYEGAGQRRSGGATHLAGLVGPSPAIWLPWHQSRWPSQESLRKTPEHHPGYQGVGVPCRGDSTCSSPLCDHRYGSRRSESRAPRRLGGLGLGDLEDDCRVLPAVTRHGIWPIHVISTSIPAAGVEVSPGSTAAWAGTGPRGPAHPVCASTHGLAMRQRVAHS